MRLTKFLLFSLPALVAFSAFPAQMPHAAEWRSVAAALEKTDPAQVAYNWGEGVQGIGMMQIADRTHTPAFSAWVERWLGLNIPRGMDELLGLHKKDPRQLEYCGYWAPATASLYLYDSGKKPEHLKVAHETAEFILHGAGRSPEGGLDHWKDRKQLWVDTLYMACPLLARLSARESNPAYLDDAIRQLLVYQRHMRDPKFHLFYHMWDWSTNHHSPELWGRGNGWVLMSIADVMEAMDRKDKRWGQLKALARQMTDGLRATQDADGMWHTVMDDPSSYPESSATMMFTYGLLKLQRLNVLPASVKPMALKAWNVVNQRYIKDGVVTGVSAGTTPNGQYKVRPVGTQTWGTGAYLMAGSEVDRCFQK